MTWTKRIGIAAALVVVAISAQAQVMLSEQDAIDLAVENNPQVEMADLMVTREQALLGAQINLADPDLIFEAPTSTELRPGLMQKIDFPLVFVRQYQAQKQRVEQARVQKEMIINQLKYNVRSTYSRIQYLFARHSVLVQYDSLMNELVKANNERYSAGQIALLEKINGETRYQLVHNQLLMNLTERENTKLELELLMFGKYDPNKEYIPDTSNFKIKTEFGVVFDSTFVSTNPSVEFYELGLDYAKKNLLTQRSKMWPSMYAGYLNQGPDNTEMLYRLRLGVSIPIWFWKYSANIKAANAQKQIAENEIRQNKINLTNQYLTALTTYRQTTEILEYFELSGLVQAREIRRAAYEGYRLGELSYYIFALNMDQAFNIELSYLDAIKNYNQSVVHLLYLRGE